MKLSEILSCKIFYQQQNQQLLHQQQELLSEPSILTSLTAPEQKEEYSSSNPGCNNNEEKYRFAVNSPMMLQQAQNESQSNTSDTISKLPERDLVIELFIGLVNSSNVLYSILKFLRKYSLCNN